MRLLLLASVLSLTPSISAAQAVYGQGYPQTKSKAFQISGGMMIPFLNYANRVDDIGWNAGAAFILNPRPGFHLRIEGEYSEVGFEGNSTSKAANYGGGIGGGRTFMSSRSTLTEGYFVAGLYNSEVCVANISGGCDTQGELQFGSKIGFDVVMGSGRIRPVFNAYWLFTWGSPYISLVPITIGLRF